MTVIANRLAKIRSQLNATMLIAVSKTQSVEAIIEALQAGQRVFGENRVQEAQQKFPPLRTAYPGIELHLIGPLQTNKALDAVELFDVIQTLDRRNLAEVIAHAIQKTGRNPRLYVEINIGREPQKAGIAPEALDEFLAICRDTCGLSITGLMCIPPQDQDPRPHFQTMRALADQYTLPHLSMGMSADYKTAIECGATEVRIGTAIFGDR
jgi:pyridoxal phosphate enzyme (YggS family)